MSLTGDTGGAPMRCGVAIADLVAGLLATQGILLALVARGRDGRGQMVDVSMLDGVVSLLAYHATTHLTTGAVPERSGNRHVSIAPYDTFPPADGDFLLAIGNDAQFQRFCDAAGAPELARDPRFATNPQRVAHHAALRDRLAARLQQRHRAEWIDVLTAAGVPCGSVRTVAEVLEDPHVTARSMIETVEHFAAGALRVLGVPIKLSQTPGSVRTAPPLLGQHTNSVLQELGLTMSAIAALRHDGVV